APAAARRSRRSPALAGGRPYAGFRRAPPPELSGGRARRSPPRSAERHRRPPDTPFPDRVSRTAADPTGRDGTRPGSGEGGPDAEARSCPRRPPPPAETACAAPRGPRHPRGPGPRRGDPRAPAPEGAAASSFPHPAQTKHEALVQQGDQDEGNG